MIAFRFDIDTRRGLIEKTPPLLDALDAAGFKATFFCVMGPEANLYEIVRLRFLADRASKAPLNVASKGGLAKIALSALLPRGVGHRNPDRLRQIISRGHELQPHGWSHIQWQRNLDNIDVEEHLRLAINALQSATGMAATGFASPGRSWNDKVLDAMDRAGMAYGGDLDGDLPFRPDGHQHLQLPVTHFETIAQMRRRGLNDDAIVETYLRLIDDHPEYCCIYEHPDDLGSAELEIFQAVFAGVRERGLEPATLSEVARSWEKRLP